MEKILVIEDEEPISELIKINLSMAGYDLYQAFDGAAGLQFINNYEFHLVILDIMLPKIDGYELLPYIIKKDIPVIIVTARDNIKDKVKGFNLGADDYITKPFEGIELIARVKAVLKRSGKTKCLNETGFDDIRVIYDQRKVYKESCEIELTMKEFELLKILIENKGIVLSREKLLELVWEYDYEGNTRTVDMHIQRLRNKLHTERIKTVYKIGYRLETV